MAHSTTATPDMTLVDTHRPAETVADVAGAVTPQLMLEERRGLWHEFGRFLLWNIIVIAAILILMAIFLT